MMTKTSLSAATWASPKGQRAYSAPQRCLREHSILACDIGGVRWHRHSCLCVVAKPIIQRIAEATLSLPPKFLIANPRLTLRVNAIRICELEISNRKYFAVFHSRSSGSSTFEPHAISFQNLIVTPRLEITISPILSIPSNFLIVTKRTFRIPNSLARIAFCPLPTPKTRIQCGREGESA
jgi:hypothetical protein